MRGTSRPMVVVGGTIALLVLVVLVIEFRLIVLATLVGVGGGVLIAPLINWLKRHLRVPRGISGLLVVLLLAAAAAGIGYGLYVMVAGQAQRLGENWPQISSDLVDRVREIQQRFPWFQHFDGVDVGGTAQQVGGLLMRGLATGLAAIAGLLLVLMVGIFTGVNAEAYFTGFLTLFPKYRRPRIAQLGRGAARMLRRWFLSHLLVSVISGAAIAIVFWALGIDYWLLIGVFTAALSFIPYVGAIITGAAACIITLGTQPDKFWWVLIAFIAVQQLEGDVTLPLIMKGSIRLPEAHLLIFVLLMGVAFGFVGMLVAAPLFAVLHYWYEAAYVPRMDAMDTPPSAGKVEIAEP